MLARAGVYMCIDACVRGRARKRAVIKRDVLESKALTLGEPVSHGPGIDHGPVPVNWRGHPEDWRSNAFFLVTNFTAML